MAIPDFQTLMLPVLRVAAQGETRAAEAVGQLSDEFKLTPDECAELLPSGRQAKMANRVHWAVTYLVKAGLAERPRRGFFAITDEGRKVLAKPPMRIDIAFLSHFEGFKEFRTRTTDDETTELELTASLAAGTPEERVEAAFEDLNSALRPELMDRILAMTPAAFEKLIVDLMLAMGYGGAGSGQHVGRTADGGVDGVINEDVLGLSIIYLQAKRNAPGNRIGVEKIREFAGVLDERGATKGVFVTTSDFAQPAKNYAERSHKRLILIDGQELTRLLIKHGVAVRVYRTLELKKLDIDYFDDLDS
ncbi:MAG: restriction endonuclease [Alphaproteobacteria bacterium]